MTQPALQLKKSVVQDCLNWFKMELRQRLISPFERASSQNAVMQL